MQKMSFYLEFSSSIMNPFESVFHPVCICMVCVNFKQVDTGIFLLHDTNAYCIGLNTGSP